LIAQASHEDERRAASAQRVLDDCPPLTLQQIVYWEAFQTLNSERAIGMSIGPIPWSKIIAYSKEYGMTRMERDRLIEAIRALDSVFVTFRNKQAAKSDK
jgi:hypothetical protein